MVKIFSIFLVMFLSMFTSVFADDEEKRDRVPSVKNVIQTLSQTDAKEVSIVDNFRHMFEDGKVTGQLRSIYSAFNNKNAVNIDAIALGGQVKYELAAYNGFNAGAAFITTHDVGFMSGSGVQRNDELSGGNGNYSELMEAYINYKYENINLRVGRQLIDTPLADSDDSLMIPNTFEAYVAKYETDELSVMAGHLLRWQGAGAGPNSGWIKNGDDGVSFVGVSYANEILEANAWYYAMSNGSESIGNKSIYVDALAHITHSDAFSIHLGAQYLSQREQENSGIESKIYGMLTELRICNLGINVVYNKALQQDSKQSFSGYGGGTLYTNMDSMLIDAITQDRDAEAIVFGLNYSLEDFSLLYAYGNFSGDKNTLGNKAHIVEQNIGVEYIPNDDLTLAVLFVKDENKEDKGSENFNNTNLRVFASYNF